MPTMEEHLPTGKGVNYSSKIIKPKSITYCMTGGGGEGLEIGGGGPGLY